MIKQSDPEKPRWAEGLDIRSASRLQATRHYSRGTAHMLSALSPGADGLYFAPVGSFLPVYIATSAIANRALVTSENDPVHPVDRHPEVTGSDSAASRALSCPHDSSVGLLFEPLSDDQRTRNEHLREALNNTPEGLHASLEPLLERIHGLSLAGNNRAWDVVSESVCSMLGTALLGTDPLATHEMQKTSSSLFKLSAGIMLARPSRIARHLLGVVSPDISAVSGGIPNEYDVSSNDMLASLVPMKAIAIASYWALLRLSQYPEYDPNAVVMESIRLDGATALTVPRGELTENNPTVLYAGSPSSMLLDPIFGSSPRVFSPDRFLDPANGEKREKLVQRYFFGFGKHRCPAQDTGIDVIRELALGAYSSGVRIHTVREPRISLGNPVNKTPTKKSSGILYNIAS